MKGKLVRIKSNHENMRTTEMIGEFVWPPTIGKCFRIFGESLTEGEKYRVIMTTKVKEIKREEGIITFKTANTTYKLIHELPEDK